MLLFYTPDITADRYTLSEEESQHCIRVLRLAEGHTLYLTNGKGTRYTAQITHASPKRCEVAIVGKQENCHPPRYYLHLAVAPTKNIDRYEYLLEKATETGVNEITPLLCAHSERRQVKTERLEKVLIAAMKQSLQTRLPQLNEPVDFSHFIRQSFDGQKYIAFCDAATPRELFWHVLPATGKALVLIGPEGDFSSAEIEQALQCGFIPVSLGAGRLRTETAGVVVCATMYIHFS